MNAVSDVIAAAAEVDGFCTLQGWRFCLIGGIAVQRWGAPRFTQDVDITLLTGFGGEGPFIDLLMKQFPARIMQAQQFALDHRVVLLKTQAGIPLDIALGGLPFEVRCVGRATAWKVTDSVSLTTCSAEDLIILKVFAARDRDWGDVQSILTRQYGRLDMRRIHTELVPLLELKGETASMEKLNAMTAAVKEQLQG